MRWLALIPNALSLSRIAIAVSYAFLPSAFLLPALVVALLTEYFDGVLARRFGWESLLGQLLDPIADRFLFLGVGLTLTNANMMTGQAFLFLALRDILVAIGFFLILFFRYEGFGSLSAFRPNLLGKLTTALQYAVFIHVLLLPAYAGWLIALTGLFGLASTASYAFRLRSLHSFGRGP